MNSLRRHWPLPVALAVLLASVGAVLALSLARTGGTFVYNRDDPYIHMAMARNFAHHGVWGATRYGFASSSSSPLWTLLLSLVCLVFGVSDVAPLVLNLAAATGLLLVAHRLLHAYEVGPLPAFVMLLASTFLVPTLWLVFGGQEHLLHLVLTLLVAHLAARLLSLKAGQGGARRDRLWLLALAPVFVATRYEGLFVLFVVCGLFLLRRRLGYAVALGALGLLPAVAYGAISTCKGWYPLPNSVLLKGNAPLALSMDGVSLFFRRGLFHQLRRHPHMSSLMVAAVVVFIGHFRYRGRLWHPRGVLLAVFCATALLHLQFAARGLSFRYDAYLVLLGTFAVGVSLLHRARADDRHRTARPLGRRMVAVAALAVALCGPLGMRAVDSAWRIPQATKNIYEQQYQMARFLREHYEGEVVGANDIGAINYLADIRNVDLWGLASMDVARAKRAGRYHTRAIAALCERKGLTAAVVYDSWFASSGGLPAEWVLAGRWTIQNNVVCGDTTLSFYAARQSAAEALRQNLRAFGPSLPDDVVQWGPYTR